MVRRIALTFAFFASLSGSYAMATEIGELSPIMQCIANCHNAGGGFGSCADACGA
jgi:hypothetical protein